MNFARHTTVAAGGHRWWVTHGDQFDAVISDQPTLVSAADAGYGVLQRLSAAVAGWAKRSCKTFLRAVEAVREQAVAEALRRGCVGAVCGHTHVAESSDGYLNTGSWVTPDRPTYAVADEAGLRLEWWWDEGRNAGA
jgi:UDP-2,3-diacylglucosamine pyrophosphatase LpxH